MISGAGWRTVLLGIAGVWGGLAGVRGAGAEPVDLRVEHRTEPLGVGVMWPALSWRTELGRTELGRTELGRTELGRTELGRTEPGGGAAAERNWVQTAYRVEVASSPELLAEGKPDFWDTGKVRSGESQGIVYAGRQMESGRRYWWLVRTWGMGAGEEKEAVSAPAWWETGLLQTDDWKAQWVGRDDAAERAVLDRVRWMWVPGVDPKAVPAGQTARFRYVLHLDAMPGTAVLHVLTGGDFIARVNGVETGHKAQWASFDREDVRGELKAGRGAAGDNVLEIDAVTRSAREAGKTFPNAIAAVLTMQGADGRQSAVVSGPGWQVAEGAGGAEQAVAVVGGLRELRVSVGSDREVLLAAPDRLESPVSLLRGGFQVQKQKTIVAARLYVTAMGAYRAYVNGQRVSDEVLAPGFTDFHKRVQYQAYDVTKLVTQGANTLGAELGAGWHSSPMLWSGVREFAGPDLLRMQLRLHFSDGTVQDAFTDAGWMATAGPVRSAEIYGGEAYDARMEGTLTGAPSRPARGRGSRAGSSGAMDAMWSPVRVGSVPAEVAITAQPDDVIRVKREIVPVTSRTVAAAHPTTVYDLGQNMVGVARLRVRGERGQTVRLRFAERLNPDGSIYTENLRNADATDEYTLRGGGGEETWEPAFTFHGFRYVEVTLLDAKAGQTPVEVAGVAGEVMNSLPEESAMQFRSSSALLNSMFELGLWGQRGNFVSVPTDCPQRDERLGWMGDAGVFWRTGAFNFDIDPFTQKFMDDVVDAQTSEGVFSNVSPNLLHVGAESVGAPGWGDAGVLVPYATWLQYGDRALLERHWGAMQRWMTFIEEKNPDYVRRNDLGPNYGDWLAPDPHSPRDMVATAYWALIARQMAEMAKALGREGDEARYERLYGQVRAAYRAAFVKGGVVAGDTQTGYVLTLYAGLAEPGERAGMTERLVENIAAHGEHLTTGFLGTPFLLFVLDEQGRADVAYKLLLSESYPSWGYMVSKGATTWWERWNGDTGDPAMNSYNHYAFGSVMAWVYRRVSGIDTDAGGAGFRHVVIAPRMDAALPSAETVYQSAYGPVRTRWERAANGTVAMDVTVPPNTRATVTLPRAGQGRLLEGGVAQQAHVTGGSLTGGSLPGGGLTVEVGSGAYHFQTE